jgi:hypothetical protein
MLFSQVKLINMRMFASYSKHAKVSKQINISHDDKVVISIHIVIMTIFVWMVGWWRFGVGLRLDGDIG